ncbi:MAG: ribonuclease HI family protein [bacterium]|nr:ribonuclease HI family protein [bacterium]
MKQLNLFDSPHHTHSNTPSDSHHFTLFVDGASRNNPGPAGAGIYLLKDSEEVCKRGFYLGVKTNNQAEYYALIFGLFLLEEQLKPSDTVRIVSDSQLLVRQINGEYQVKKPELKPLHALAQQIVHACSAHVMHVLRTENKQADKMANIAIDKKLSIPPIFIERLAHHAITL